MAFISAFIKENSDAKIGSDIEKITNTKFEMLCLERYELIVKDVIR